MKKRIIIEQYIDGCWVRILESSEIEENAIKNLIASIRMSINNDNRFFIFAWDDAVCSIDKYEGPIKVECR